MSTGTPALPTPPLPPARHGVKRRMRRGAVVWLTILIVLLVIAIAIGSYLLVLSNAFGKATRLDDVFPDGDRPAAVEGAQTILLLGSDTRGDDDSAAGGRSDTIMVVHVPADHQSVEVMSIMRDNWVPIPGHGEAKINAAMAWGGIPLVVQTVESFLDTRIDHVALVDFEGFAGLSTALGGVTVDNPTAFTAFSGEKYAEGSITLEGKRAIDYVRERHAFATGDYMRVANQQRFLKAVLEQTVSKDTLLNPVKTVDLVSAIAPYLQVDDGLSTNYLAGLGLALGADFDQSKVHFFTTPTLGTGTISGQSVVKPDWDGIQVIRDDIKAGTLGSYTPPKR